MFCTAGIIFSFLLIAICCFEDDISAMFWVSLVASVVVGIQCALGESVNLGFMKTFPGNCISYYGSGTGFAGITGAVIFIALTPLGLSDAVIYMIALPTAIPYLLAFVWLDRQKKKYPYVLEEGEANNDIDDGGPDEIAEVTTYDKSRVSHLNALDNVTNDTVSKSNNTSAIQEQKNLENEGVADNKKFTCENVVKIFKRVGLLMANLSIVYFLEYTITTSFTVACTSQIIDKKEGRDKEWVYENAYVIFNLCY